MPWLGSAVVLAYGPGWLVVMGREVWAEQALLGAILSDPAGQQHLLELVRRDDMRRPWHGQVLAAMQRLRRRGVLPAPAEVYEELKKDPDLPQTVSGDAVPLVNLMEAGHAPHASAYAAMVIDGGIRQRLALAGSRMTQAAEEVEGEPLQAALRLTEAARRELDACRIRWERLPEPMRRELPAPTSSMRELRAARRARGIRGEIARLRQELQAGGSVSAGERLRLIAQQLADIAAAVANEQERPQRGPVSGAARPSGPDAEAADAVALRELAAGPGQISAVTGWLAPGDFARPENGELYAVMRDLNAAGLPVDPVTISWEAARRGIRVDPSSLAGRTGIFAEAAAAEVRRRAVLARIAQAGRQIQASTADPTLSAGTLLLAVGERLRQAEHDRIAEPHRRAQVIAIAGRDAARHGAPEHIGVLEREAAR
jgi:replicative DNA helicase